MKRALYLTFLICASTSASASAVEAPPKDSVAVEIQNGYYWILPSAYRLGYTVNLLKSGYPIGYLKQEIPEEPPAETAAEMTQNMIAATEANERNEERVKALVARTHQEIALTEAAPALPSSPLPETGAVNFDFEICARNALLLLKRKIQLEAALKLGEFKDAEALTARKTLDAISAQLQTHRGNAGLSCSSGSKYLDGVEIQGDIAQVKTLMTLLSRKKDERRRLERALALAFDPSRKSELRATWKNIWLKLSIVSVFTSQPLPTYPEVVRQMTAAEDKFDAADSQNGVGIRIKMTRDNGDAQAQLQAGLTILEDLDARP